MKIRLVFLSFIVLFSTAFSSAHADPAHIFIFRHGEKRNDEDRDLSNKGYKRAAALGRFFSQKRFQDAYGEPAVFFAARAKNGKSRRSVQTITPAAEAYGAKVNDSYWKGEEKELMEEILKDPSLDGKTVLICWNHTGIPRFLKPLDIKDAPKDWTDGAYDRFWILDRTARGEWKFKDRPQRLLPGDSEE